MVMGQFCWFPGSYSHSKCWRTHAIAMLSVVAGARTFNSRVGLIEEECFETGCLVSITGLNVHF